MLYVWISYLKKESLPVLLARVLRNPAGFESPFLLLLLSSTWTLLELCTRLMVLAPDQEALNDFNDVASLLLMVDDEEGEDGGDILSDAEDDDSTVLILLLLLALTEASLGDDVDVVLFFAT